MRRRLRRDQRGPTRGGIWTPTQISGCALWLRADLGITLNGANVSAWADQASEIDFTEAAAINQPEYLTSGIGSRAAVDFVGYERLVAGSSALSDVITASAWTIFGVVRPNSALTPGTHYWARGAALADSGGYWASMGPASGQLSGGHWDGGQYRADVTVTNGTSYRWRHSFDGSTIRCAVNGGTDVTVSAGSVDVLTYPLQMGSVVTTSGIRVGEIICYDRLLNSSEQAAVQAYMSDLWGL